MSMSYILEEVRTSTVLGGGNACGTMNYRTLEHGMLIAVSIASDCEGYDPPFSGFCLNYGSICTI